MEDEKKETFVFGTKKDNSPLGLGLKSDEFVLLALLALILLVMWGMANSFDLRLLLLPIILILLFLLVTDISYANRSHKFWSLVAGLAVAAGALLFEMCYHYPSSNLFVFLAPVVLFYFFTFQKIIRDSEVASANPVKVKAMELIKLCLKSKGFDSLLILMMGIFFYAMFIARQTAVSSNEEMAGLFVLIVWALATILFFVVIFIGMAFFTSKVRKTTSSVFVFMMAAIAVPIFILISIFFV